MSNLVSSLIDLVATLPKIWAIFVLSMIPVIELRGAIPLAVAWGLTPFSAFMAALLGNLVPILPLLFFLGPVSQWLQERFVLFRRFFNWVFRRSRQHEKTIQKYGYWGLALFVAVPFPGTGVWVGSALAFLLGLKIIPSFLAMSLGVFLAGIAMMVLSLGVAGLAASQGTLWAVLVVMILIGIILWRRKKS